MMNNLKLKPKTVLSHSALIIISLALLYPIFWMVAGSVRPPNEIFSGGSSIVPSQVTIEAYSSGWFAMKVSFGRFFLNSFIVAILSTVGTVMSSSVTAYAFARLKFPGRDVCFALMLGTLMLPYQVTLIPQYVLFLRLDWVNTWFPLIVPKFFAVDAFFIFLMVQFFKQLPRELDEAAQMDGCGSWRIYWKIILPLSVPVMATAAIFSFIWTWDDFFGPLIYISDMHSYTVPLGLSSFVDSSGVSNWNQLFAMSVLSLTPVFLIFLIFQRLLIEGIATTGMKR